jgi:hypothetical protein
LTKKKKERKRESETPADLHVGGVIAFSMSHLLNFLFLPFISTQPIHSTYIEVCRNGRFLKLSNKKIFAFLVDPIVGKKKSF